MQTLHINHDKTRLIIFFAGFYTSPDCFAEFDNGEADILFVYDYSNLDFSELQYFDYTPYTQIDLIAYSYGVFAANEAAPYLPEITNSTAIAGTIYPIDDVYGINKKIYNLMLDNFSEQVVQNFKAKMEANSKGKIAPSKRTVENLKDELLNIKNYVSKNKITEKFKFEKVIITTRDKIMPYLSQQHFWAKHRNTVEVNTGHFPFFDFSSFDEILEN